MGNRRSPPGGTHAFLKGVRIFSELSEEELGRIAAELRPRHLKRGETLFVQGDPGGALFVVEDGSVGVSVRLADGKNLEIADFHRGDFFGEMSIFESEPRSATCTAKSRCRLLALREHDFHGLLATSPAAAARIMRQMLLVTKRRLQNAGDFLSEMVQWGEEARRRAVTDPLTGLYNRRYLDEALEQQCSGTPGASRRFALVMLDLDHFREINETYSQDVGDRVIIAATGCFRRHLRPADIAARYGGDEFTIILPDTGAETAGELMERIRAEVERLDLLEEMRGTIRRVTTSQGIACFPDHGSDQKTLREAADAALYAAKEAGRNRIAVASAQAGPQPGE